MESMPNAVELTVENAWFIAEMVGAGTFPWVLAITTPYSDEAQRSAFFARQRDELTQLGLLSSDGVVNPAVAEWIKVVCFPERWLDLRYVGPGTGNGGEDLLRGIVAQNAGIMGKAGKAHPSFNTVVALRNAQLVTFTAMDIDDPRALVPVLGVGLSARPPARFEEFSMPMRVGARADERLRSGESLDEVLDYLGIPVSARPVVQAVFSGPRSYVEIVAGCNRDGEHTTTDVGLSIVDSTAGRVLVSPSRAFDGEWVSTFSAGTPFATAVAIDQLIANLPDGQWFPGQRLSRDFSSQPS
ncbi:ESX secretion-associated protein EspG [Mycobacterium marinum]|uniref:ESX secretion-associated protein EspG n=1 Tax=Mycobacterium marinum TaxID=1781 RepID=UPI00356342D1